MSWRRKGGGAFVNSWDVELPWQPVSVSPSRNGSSGSNPSGEKSSIHHQTVAEDRISWWEAAGDRFRFLDRNRTLAEGRVGGRGLLRIKDRTEQKNMFLLSEQRGQHESRGREEPEAEQLRGGIL